MGNFIEHIALAIVINYFIYLILNNLIGISLNLELMFFIIFSSVFASVFPDIDHKKSKIHKMTRSFISILISLTLSIYFFKNYILIFLSLLVFSAVIYLLIGFFPFKHRGKTHTITFGIIFSAIFGGISFIFLNSFLPAIFFFTSHFSHLILDQALKY